MNQDQAFLLSKGIAISVIEDLRLGNEPSGELGRSFSPLVEVPGGFRGLHDSLKAVCDKLPRPKSQRDSCQEFEVEGSIITHKALKNLPDELLGDAEFWLWLTISQCRDIVQWRHGDNASLGNFGLEDKNEGLLRRLFLRADMVFSEADSDPYLLARKGTQDFWRSFMIRRNYASVKTMARAFAKRVNFSEGSNLEDSQVRILGPKITQLHSTFTYELLDDSQCEGFVRRESERVLTDGT
jgi:hypothetical protein